MCLPFGKERLTEEGHDTLKPDSQESEPRKCPKETVETNGVTTDIVHCRWDRLCQRWPWDRTQHLLCFTSSKGHTFLTL